MVAAFSNSPALSSSLGPADDWRAADEYGYHVLLIVAVIIAWGGVLLVNMPLWDDWVLVAYSDAGTLWEFFRQMGRRDQYELVAPFTALGEPRAWISAALLLSCSIPCLLFIVIRRVLLWPAPDAFWAALLTALVPLNQARFILSTIPYAFSSFFFLLALVLLAKDLEHPGIVRRLATAALLLMAFTTNSFLVLAWIAPTIVMVDALRKHRDEPTLRRRLQTTLRDVIARGELLVLPVLYWAAKLLLQPTYGLYANYNKFRMGPLVGLKDTIVTLFDQFRGIRPLLPRSTDLPEVFAVTVLGILFLTMLARVCRLRLVTASENMRPLPWTGAIITFACSALLVISALFPYVMVGQPPRFSGLWETRHQTTLMLASGFVAIAALRLTVARRFLWKTAAATAAICLLLDLTFTQRLLADAHETGTIMALFKEQPSPPGTMMLVVEDDRAYRALDRFFPFYELSFLVNGGRSGPNLAISNREVIDPATGSYPTSAVPAVISALTTLCESHRSNPQYGFANFVSNGHLETVKLLPNGDPPAYFHIIGHFLGMTTIPAAPPVRLERTKQQFASACRGPCCTPN